jgi:predicted amidohydrolase
MAIAGSLPEAEKDTIYNTDYLIDTTGEIAGTYRKVHLFSLYGEHKKFGRGKSAKVFQTTLGKVGLMICYDLRFPGLSAKMALEGAEIICVSSLWPLIRLDNWSVLLRARAIENQLFVIGCNGCGTEEKITWGGGSAIVSALGTVVAQAGTDEQIIAGVLDRQEMEEFRTLITCFQDRVPEAYR